MADGLPFEDGAQIKKDIQIEKIMTIYLFEFTSSYKFEGERHDFWEMVYVDAGTLDIIADEKYYRLKQGDLAFHHPSEFHALASAGKNSPSVIVISFVTHSPAMQFFVGRILNVPVEQRVLISDIIHEAKNVYKEPLGLAYLEKNRREDVVFGAEQMLYANLEKALITFYRSSNSNVRDSRMSDSGPRRGNQKFTDSIIEYLLENMGRDITLDELCAKFHIGKTQMNVVFKRSTGQSVICYFHQMKMGEAKRLIRQGGMNITEVGKSLGFDNVHHFSSTFKKHFGMSPTEYNASVMAYEERLQRKK